MVTRPPAGKMGWVSEQCLRHRRNRIPSTGTRGPADKGLTEEVASVRSIVQTRAREAHPRTSGPGARRATYMINVTKLAASKIRRKFPQTARFFSAPHRPRPSPIRPFLPVCRGRAACRQRHGRCGANRPSPSSMGSSAGTSRENRPTEARSLVTWLPLCEHKAKTSTRSRRHSTEKTTVCFSCN